MTTTEQASPADVAVMLRLSEKPWVNVSTGETVEFHRLLDVLPETNTRTYELLFALPTLVVRGLVEQPVEHERAYCITITGRDLLRRMRVIE